MWNSSAVNGCMFSDCVICSFNNVIFLHRNNWAVLRYVRQECDMTCFFKVKNDFIFFCCKNDLIVFEPKNGCRMTLLKNISVVCFLSEVFTQGKLSFFLFCFLLSCCSFFRFPFFRKIIQQRTDLNFTWSTLSLEWCLFSNFEPSVVFWYD